MKKHSYYPNLEKFIELSGKGNTIPVYRDILADTDTPVSAFMKISTGGNAFLFESVEGGEKWGRYSILGTNPRMVLRSRGRTVEIIEDGTTRFVEGDPIEVLRDTMAKYKAVEVETVPRFSGGAIGYMGYDTIRHIERLPDIAPKDLDNYDLYFIFTDTFLLFDNVENKISVISNVFIPDNGDIKTVYETATGKIDDLITTLRNGSLKTAEKDEKTCKKEEQKSGNTGISSNFEHEKYLKAVKKIKEYILEGDIIQTVLSQRFSTVLDTEPFDIYRALRVVNPSPYMFYLSLDNVTLVGSSPEVLVRVIDKDVHVNPIAGTRWRGATEAEDLKLEEELLADPKECAEHIMLVDLGRNDIGRVCETGSVNVSDFMTVERYSHVMHIVSTVVGRLKDGADSFDALRATFPAGTLSGAPKIRAMEIIEELEPCKRGIYGGSVGYFSYTGNTDMCIAIRTLIIKDGTIYIQAGAGIVAYSVPQTEYEETENKARGMLKAIEMARSGLE